MASTYSTDLKIQLMATGENSGTWGTITNTNLGTTLEEAICRSVDVAFSGDDVTLTASNSNGTQSFRNLRLNLTGTGTAGQILQVPLLQQPMLCLILFEYGWTAYQMKLLNNTI